MDLHLHALIDFVAEHAGWAYATVFLAALLESVPVIGSAIPGTTVIVALSALISSGHLSLPIILTAACCGGALGDGLAFFAGHRLKRTILELWPLSAYPTVIAQSEEFFRRRGELAVFFARFVAPVRAFVPVIAGVLKMPPTRFIAVNIPAVVLWAAAHVLASAFAGTLLGTWGNQIETYALPALAIVTLIIFIVWVARHWHLCAAHVRTAPDAGLATDQPRATDLR